ncbi:tail fiber domain-containing protein [Photobacterium sp. S4TG1]|uniref:tail fiber domain-containing protein n=1 Tax=Photobacterium sp. S4TG1 TaxID=3114587 RepID=UPI002E18D657|nr:tail fiber domain-containing protein [Photobacterium sp. S4TG1]
MIVFGILRDLANRPIANGLLQIVATSTTNSVFIGSSVYMKANSRGYYQFELLPGTYSLYVQPSKQSDVEYLGETVVTDEMPDGSLNSLVDITVPILPKLVQQTIDAANQAALSASNIERNIERTNVLVIQTSNKANEVKDNLQQMNVLVQTATDNVERIKESLNHSQQIKDDTLGLYNATNFSKQASRQYQLAAKESEDNALESAQQAALEVEQAKAVIRIDIVNAAKSQANRSFQEAERAQSSAQLSQTAKESAQQSVNNALAIKQQVSERIADVELLQQHVQEQVDISARQIELAQHSVVMVSENVVVTTEKANIATQQAGIAEQQAVNALESANNAEVSAHLAQVSADVATGKSDVSIEKAISVSLGLSQTLTAKEAAVEAARRAELAAASLSGAMLEQGGIDLSSGVTPEPLVDINGAKRACFWKVTVAGTVNGIEYGVDDSLVYSASMDTYYKIDNTESVTSINGQRGVVVLSKNDVGLEHVPNIAHTVEANLNSVPVRDNHGDIQARLFSSSFSNQSEFSGALAFRIDNVSDSYIRFCSNQGAIRQWLDIYSKYQSDQAFLAKDAQAADSKLLNGNSDYYSPRNKPTANDIGAVGISSNGNIELVGGAVIANDGNIYSSLWGNDWLTNRALIGKLNNVNSRLDMFTSIEPDYLEFYIDGGAKGIHYFNSDARLKKNIKRITNCTRRSLSKIKDIEFVQYDWDKSKSGWDGHVNMGVTSQQLLTIDSEFVNIMSDGFLMPNINSLLVHALKAINELSEKCEEMEKSISTNMSCK